MPTEHPAEFLRALLDASPFGVIALDVAGDVRLWSRGAQNILGWKEEDVIGHPLPSEIEMLPSSNRDDVEAWTAPWQEGTIIVIADNSRHRSSDRETQSLVEREAAPDAIIEVDEDRVQAIQTNYTRELELRNREIERANRHKSEFLANMSHELRTPLHTVIGFSELLSEESKGPLNADQKRFINHIHKDSQHLLALINEILDLSRIEAGKLELRKEPLDVAAMFDDVLSSIRPQCLEKAIALERHVHGPIVVVGDRIRVKQILYNLLSNAVKFTPKGGRVQVEAVPVDGFARISVSDTGIGIAPEEHESVFDTFYQVSAAGTREGTGLGLPITRRLVEEHGGRMELESDPGRGSRFTFTIPLKTAK